ncbi:MAG: DUF3052 domain-containing protein [Alphaproteobacteria bacterium]|nr:MAG: DUF3052 domain-containing protein [Alphaproteobacteria bacterium]
MTAGYSGTPLIKKLGIREGFAVTFLDAPEDYGLLLGPLPVGVHEAAMGLDFVQGFFTRRAVMAAALETWLPRIKRDGMIWVSWPKKAAKVETDITEDVVRAVALPMGLVDVKVCAVDTIWSGLKLVIRKELR